MAAPIEGGECVVSEEIPADCGTVHGTSVVTPTGDVRNTHLTHTPNSGGNKTSSW